MTEVQKQRLLTVKAQILAEPEMYNQGTFGSAINPCGSPACIAGWLVWNATPRKYRQLLLAEDTHEIESRAYALIGGAGEDDVLFGTGNSWPTGYRGIAPNAQDAAKMIDYVIAREVVTGYRFSPKRRHDYCEAAVKYPYWEALQDDRCSLCERADTFIERTKPKERP